MTTSAAQWPALGLVFVAGIALAVQNALLTAMVARGLNQATALALNSAVGLTLLAVWNVALYGPSAASTVGRAWQWWFLLPGILGTFVVFAVVLGYRRSGAAVPTIAVIAGQILAAVFFDTAGITSRPSALSPIGWLGVAMFIAGAGLVLLSHRP